MNEQKMMQPVQGQSLPAPTVEEMGLILLHMEQLMQGMMNVVSVTNQNMEQIKRELRQLTPITGAQEKALGEKIRQRAEQLCEEYNLSARCVPMIANAIRKDVKLEGGVRSIRELPRVEYPVYVDRIAMWDDYGAMKAIRKANKEK